MSYGSAGEHENSQNTRRFSLLALRQNMLCSYHLWKLGHLLCANFSTRTIILIFAKLMSKQSELQTCHVRQCDLVLQPSMCSLLCCQTRLMFEGEWRSLQLIEQTDTVSVPKPVKVSPEYAAILKGSHFQKTFRTLFSRSFKKFFSPSSSAIEIDSINFEVRPWAT